MRGFFRYPTGVIRGHINENSQPKDRNAYLLTLLTILLGKAVKTGLQSIGYYQEHDLQGSLS